MPKQSASNSSATQTRRKRRSSKEVSDRILEAAAEEFELSGYSGATTAAIARRAEVTEAQIFRFYASKQDLFRAAIFKPLNEHLTSFQLRHAQAQDEAGSDRELAREYIYELQAFIEQHSRMFMSLIVASAYSPDTTEGVGEMEGLLAYFDKGADTMTRRTGGEKPSVDTKLMVRVSFAAVLANLMFKDWLFPAGMASKEEIRDAIADFVIDGINVTQS